MPALHAERDVQSAHRPFEAEHGRAQVDAIAAAGRKRDPDGEVVVLAGDHDRCRAGLTLGRDVVAPRPHIRQHRDRTDDDREQHELERDTRPEPPEESSTRTAPS